MEVTIDQWRARKKLRTNIFQLKYRNFNSGICRRIWIFTISKWNIFTVNTYNQRSESDCKSVAIYTRIAGAACVTTSFIVPSSILAMYTRPFFCSLTVFLRKRCYSLLFFLQLYNSLYEISFFYSFVCYNVICWPSWRLVLSALFSAL